MARPRTESHRVLVLISTRNPENLVRALRIRERIYERENAIPFIPRLIWAQIDEARLEEMTLELMCFVHEVWLHGEIDEPLEGYIAEAKRLGHYVVPRDPEAQEALGALYVRRPELARSQTEPELFTKQKI